MRSTDRGRRASGYRASLRLVLLAATMVALSGAPGTVCARTLDTDRDGLTNAFELGRALTNPRLADTDRDGTPDGAEDPDADGLVTA
jgi:hypothetical protein